jgi:DeoR/GlpR family transcriptional regulator of sugar metabolism
MLYYKYEDACICRLVRQPFKKHVTTGGTALRNSRTNQILELLTNENKIEISRLAELLQVSQVTIRKDIASLTSQGLVVREHGYAVLRSPDDINGRIAYHYEAKKEIASRAASLVSDGDSVMIESGSCCALLAETLTTTKKDLTIITNSAFIADFIRRKSNFQLILLGGIYQPDAQVLVGPLIRQCAENFYVHTLFIGTDGYSARTGFTNSDQLRAQAVYDMAQSADQVVILTESEKFSRHGVVPLNIRKQLKTVITDRQIDPATAAQLQAQQVEVLTV